MHGNLQWVKCLNCDKRYTVQHIRGKLKKGIEIPECEVCQGILKPDVVFFGEALPPEVLDAATAYSMHCDLFLVVGSSLVVYPAALMPGYAKEAGAKLIIVNIGETPYDSRADIVIEEKAGDVMSKILEKIREKI